MTDLQRSRKTSKKRSPFRRFLKYTLITLLILFVITGGVVGYMIYQMSSMTASSQQDLERGDKSEFREEAVDPVEDPISVLFLGLDSRDDDLSGRTDAMLLATFNPDDKSIKMLNIPRDSLVEIVGRGTRDKINHAHAFGGVDMTIDTVENLLDIPVDYVVSLNFIAFMEIVDTIGGVTVDVPMPISDTDNATYGTIEIDEGEQTLNGEEALAYVRMRKQDPRGDLGRGDRQKDVIEAVIRQSADFRTITRFNSLMDSLDRNMSTNLSFGNMVSMHGYAGDLDDIEQYSFDGYDTTEGGVYYYVIRDESRAEISQTFKEHLEISQSNSGTAESGGDGESAGQ
ncbi:LCP family protein [Salipaludibacillus sp. CUR1]|uniref:LCP family glycopolymer transferase n=1 Tax=Salipaludibacillus sp. CUR1 TaxID=2820003 RepID=UPI001E616CA2|nr:LCP family protein [Salipaludibacillus sp. CUR1]MCE7791166.1 LCP family protein [Salipaludibacillus sp. CUR1]